MKAINKFSRVMLLYSYPFIFIISFFIFGCGSGSSTASGGPPGFDDKDIPLTSDSIIEAEVMLEDKLSELPLPEHCGVRLTEMSLKYKIVKLIRGKYEGSKILIHHICVREAIEEKWIENEVKYTYKLKRRKMGLFNNKYVSVNDFDVIQ